MKKSLKKKISNYGFWISLLTVIFIIVKNILSSYGIEIKTTVAIEIISGIIFIFVAFGIIKENKKDSIKEIQEDIKSEIEINSVIKEDK